MNGSTFGEQVTGGGNCQDVTYTSYYYCDGGGCGYDAVQGVVDACWSNDCDYECQQVNGGSATGYIDDGASCREDEIHVYGGGSIYASGGSCGCSCPPPI
jgi:hypothetical protein